MVKPIPDGYTSVTPYLILEDAARAIDFYKRAFGAKEIVRMPMGDRIGHAELQIGNARIMLADENLEAEIYGAKHHGGSPVRFVLYVEDVDSFAENAVAAGAGILRPIQNEFYGDRSGRFMDPFGYQWIISTHVEDVSPQEMKERMRQALPSA